MWRWRWNVGGIPFERTAGIRQRRIPLRFFALLESITPELTSPNQLFGADELGQGGFSTPVSVFSNEGPPPIQTWPVCFWCASGKRPSRRQKGSHTYVLSGLAKLVVYH